MIVDQEAVIAHFLQWARSVQDRNLNAVEVIREMTDYYQETRITGSDLDEDRDMLLFQWGVGKHPLLAEPEDLRDSTTGEHESASPVAFDSKNLMYLDFTRQVVASPIGDDDDDEEFEDTAVQMSLTLVYGAGGHKNESGNLWIASPKRMDHDLKKFAANPFVSAILELEPTRYVGTVDFAG